MYKCFGIGSVDGANTHIHTFVTCFLSFYVNFVNDTQFVCVSVSLLNVVCKCCSSVSPAIGGQLAGVAPCHHHNRSWWLFFAYPF